MPMKLFGFACRTCCPGDEPPPPPPDCTTPTLISFVRGQENAIFAAPQPPTFPVHRSFSNWNGVIGKLAPPDGTGPLNPSCFSFSRSTARGPDPALIPSPIAPYLTPKEPHTDWLCGGGGSVGLSISSISGYNGGGGDIIHFARVINRTISRIGFTYDQVLAPTGSLFDYLQSCFPALTKISLRGIPFTQFFISNPGEGAAEGWGWSWLNMDGSQQSSPGAVDYDAQLQIGIVPNDESPARAVWKGRHGGRLLWSKQETLTMNFGDGPQISQATDAVQTFDITQEFQNCNSRSAVISIGMTCLPFLPFGNVEWKKKFFATTQNPGFRYKVFGWRVTHNVGLTSAELVFE